MKRRRVWLILAVAAAMVLALGVPLLAAEGRAPATDSAAAPPLDANNAAEAGFGDAVDAAGAASITTGSSTYDPTILTKFIPGSAFVPYHGSAPMDSIGGQIGCIRPSTGSFATSVDGYAPVELPDGALLTGVTFLGRDSYGPANMVFAVRRSRVTSTLTFPPTPPSIADDGALIVAGNSSGTSGDDSWFLDVNPDVRTGSYLAAFFQSNTSFFTLHWSATTAAGANHKLCGAVVAYKLPASGDNQTFTPLTPCAIFDSRTSQGGTGTFAANEKRDITVTGDTSAIGGEGDCGIPTTATAVQVNVLVLSPAQTGTLKAWAQGATEPAGLVAVSNDLPRWNGSSTVPIASNDQMSVKMKNTAAEVRLVVTGYFSAVSNMGN